MPAALQPGLVDEEDFCEVMVEEIPLTAAELESLVKKARGAREGRVTLFTSERHTGAAGLSYKGKVYRAAGADDTAFHYRYPIGGLLQQAASEQDCLMRAIVVVEARGAWPRVNYPDRQYGFESSSFNQLAGKASIALILTDGKGRFRVTTFDEALPHPFSAARFMPEATNKFLGSHGVK